MKLFIYWEKMKNPQINEGLNSNLDGQHDSDGITNPLTGTSGNEINDYMEKNEEPIGMTPKEGLISNLDGQNDNSRTIKQRQSSCATLTPLRL